MTICYVADSLMMIVLALYQTEIGEETIYDIGWTSYLEDYFAPPLLLPDCLSPPSFFSMIEYEFCPGGVFSWGRMFLTGIHLSAIYLSEGAIVLPMYRKSLLVLLLILIAVAGGTYYGCYTQEKESVQLNVASNPAAQQGGTETGAEITVYVTGAINKPGVVTVKEGARTADAVNACGGLLPTADAEKVNMAQVLKDGQQVRVPEKAGAETAAAAKSGNANPAA